MPSAGATSSATDTPYTVSPAVELEAALCDPKREPLSAFYHWVLLDPPSQLKNDPIELKEIYNTIAELWNRIRDNRVRNREDLERWQTEAQDIEVRDAVHIPSRYRGGPPAPSRAFVAKAPFIAG